MAVIEFIGIKSIGIFQQSGCSEEKFFFLNRCPDTGGIPLQAIIPGAYLCKSFGFIFGSFSNDVYDPSHSITPVQSPLRSFKDFYAFNIKELWNVGV